MQPKILPQNINRSPSFQLFNISTFQLENMEKFFEQLNLLERLDGLIRRKATGKPTELARRLGICERKVYNLIGELKAIGVPIAYSNERESGAVSICPPLRKTNI